MHVFPAEVPAAEAPRPDIVEVRVARKVAPLFGVPVEDSPFGRTWICDFTALSLAELGRGAPYPTRSEQVSLDDERQRPPDDARVWEWAGRAVWTRQRGPTPGALSNATLRRFNPDTKAAAVLTGANRLLRGSTAAVASVCRHLATTGCDPSLRLAVWAGLVLEVYRAQPALVVAAVQARLVQRSLSLHWGDQVFLAGVDTRSAASEIGPTVSDGGLSPEPAECQPTGFELIDMTLPFLGLDQVDSHPALLTRDALDDLASAWCHRLLAVGRPGRGVVWLVEDEAGSRHAHAMVRVGAVVAPFVASVLGQDAQRAEPPMPPPLPEVAVLDAAPALTRRAHLLTTHIASNYLRYQDDLLLRWPRLRPATRDLVEEAARRGARSLGPADPVTIQLDIYASYLNLWDQLRSPSPAAEDPEARAAAVDRLEAAGQATTEAWLAGRVDPGAASYLLEVAAVALREADPTRHESRARARWEAILASRGLDPASGLADRVDSLSPAQVFHLQHYTAWLASSGRRGDLRRALALQEAVASVRTEVSRREPAVFAAKSAAARDAHELATSIATRLALATPEREHLARERAIRTAVRHAQSVLGDRQIATCHPAETVAEALSLAISAGIEVDPSLVKATTELLDAALTGVIPPSQTDRMRLWRDRFDRLNSPQPPG